MRWDDLVSPAPGSLGLSNLQQSQTPQPGGAGRWGGRVPWHLVLGAELELGGDTMEGEGQIRFAMRQSPSSWYVFAI